jgi:hypothetical protein
MRPGLLHIKFSTTSDCTYFLPGWNRSPWARPGSRPSFHNFPGVTPPGIRRSAPYEAFLLITPKYFMPICQLRLMHAATVRQIQPPTTDFLPLQGTDYVEFYVGNAKQAAHYYKSAFGFQSLAYAVPRQAARTRSAMWSVRISSLSFSLRPCGLTIL